LAPSWQTVLAGEHSPLRFGMGDGPQVVDVRAIALGRLG
jgi:hypothetical protein